MQAAEQEGKQRSEAAAASDARADELSRELNSERLLVAKMQDMLDRAKLELQKSAATAAESKKQRQLSQQQLEERQSLLDEKVCAVTSLVYCAAVFRVTLRLYTLRHRRNTYSSASAQNACSKPNAALPSPTTAGIVNVPIEHMG